VSFVWFVGIIFVSWIGNFHYV